MTLREIHEIIGKDNWNSGDVCIMIDFVLNDKESDKFEHEILGHCLSQMLKILITHGE